MIEALLLVIPFERMLVFKKVSSNNNTRESFKKNGWGAITTYYLYVIILFLYKSIYALDISILFFTF